MNHPHPNPSTLLRLYVCGESPNSLLARALLEDLRRDLGTSCFRLEVVDILEDPFRALLDGVPVAPMLVRLAPTPVLRLVGDLSERADVLRLLGLDHGGG